MAVTPPPAIIGIGMSTVDRLYLLEDVSQLPGGTVLDYSVQGGGPCATAMAAVAVLGTRCGMIACVGDDDRGVQALDSLRAVGVDVSRSVVKPVGATPMVMVLVDRPTGDRHFLALSAEPPLASEDDIDWDYVAGARILHLDNWVRGPGALIEKAHNLGPIISVDTNMSPGQYPEWIEHVDVLIGSADVRADRRKPEVALKEAEQIAGHGPHTAILTLGREGCVGVGPEGPFRLPAFEVKVVDTCGTGDVFHGAFVYALNRGWRTRDCAVFASAAAALSATKLGGRAGLATAAQVAEFLRARGCGGPWEVIGEKA
jgi:sugar/nucleoside kinase (ribokinase family)